MTYTVLESQCLADIAIEVYGDVKGVFWLLEDNPTLTAITDRLLIGQVLQVRAGQLNPRYVTYLADFAPFASVESVDFAEGIGAWWLEEYVIKEGNIAPRATVSASTTFGGFNAQNVVMDPLPSPIIWQQHGWNDGTYMEFPDWLQLQWEAPQTIACVELVGLTSDGSATYSPGVTTVYANRDYQLQAWVGGEWETLVSVTGNTFSYRAHRFGEVVTTKIRLYVTDGADRLYSRIVQIRVLDN